VEISGQNVRSNRGTIFIGNASAVRETFPASESLKFTSSRSTIMKDTNAGSNLVFFLLGAAVGAAVALLYAPQEGEATRRLIGEKAVDAKDKAAELSHSVADVTREKWEAAATKGKELLNRGKDATQEAIDNASASVYTAVESA